MHRPAFSPGARSPMRCRSVPGGYRATARWDFASGSRQASWLGAHVQIVEADGTRRLKPNGAPEVRTILFAGGERHDVRRLGRDRPQRHRHRQLFGRQSVHPGKIRSVARRSRGAARTRAALPALHQHGVRTGLRRGLARRRARHAGCRHRTGARQGFGRPQGDAREQRGSGCDRPHRRQPARGACLSLCDGRRGVARSDAHAASSPKTTARRFAWPRPGPSIRRPRWSMPPITWRAPRPCSAPTSSSAASATCTPSRSRSRPATPITKTSAR